MLGPMGYCGQEVGAKGGKLVGLGPTSLDLWFTESLDLTVLVLLDNVH